MYTYSVFEEASNLQSQNRSYISLWQMIQDIYSLRIKGVFKYQPHILIVGRKKKTILYRKMFNKKNAFNSKCL